MLKISGRRCDNASSNTSTQKLLSRLFDNRQDELDAMRQSFRYNQLVEGIFGPIYVGAVIFALDRRRRGLHAGYGESIGMGLRNWGRLWTTRFGAWFLIILGVFALIVDAEDEQAEAFYSHFGFAAFAPRQLFMTLATILKR